MGKPIILHEVNQLDRGGIEEVVRCIVKHDRSNQHAVLSYKDGPMRAALEEAGAEVSVANGHAEGLDLQCNLIHVHTGGNASHLVEAARQQGVQVPVVETIHSPVKSPIRRDLIAQKIGVSNTVARINDGLCIYNGIDLERMAPRRSAEQVRADLKIEAEDFVVGRLGRLGYDKDVEGWLLVICELQQRGVQVVPVVVGDEAANAKGFVGRLKVIADCLPVHGVRWVPASDCPADYYQIFDCFLYPSPTEGFGLVFAEAMHFGVPIVTLNTEVAVEVVGGAGVLVGDSIPAMADAVLKIKDNPDVASMYGQIGMDRVENYFEAERMSLEYQSLYRALLNGGSHGVGQLGVEQAAGKKAVLDAGRATVAADGAAGGEG